MGSVKDVFVLLNENVEYRAEFLKDPAKALDDLGIKNPEVIAPMRALANEISTIMNDERSWRYYTCLEHGLEEIKNEFESILGTGTTAKALLDAVKRWPEPCSEPGDDDDCPDMVIL